MKKYLSLILILIMVAVTAVPAVYAEGEQGSDGIMLLSGDSTLQTLPYKIETFKRFRGSVNSTSAAGMNGLNLGIAVKPYMFPLFSDTALVGVHKGSMGNSFDLTGADATSSGIAAMNIGIIGELPSSGGTIKSERALKLKASSETEIVAVSAGFVPNDVLENSEAVKFTWKERAVTLGTDAKILLQWVGADGLGISNIAEIAHDTAISTTAGTYTDVNLYVANGAYKYNGGVAEEITDFSLTTPPTGAVGLKVVIGFKGGERYYRELGVELASNTFASIEGDLIHYSAEANSTTVKFTSPVISGRENVKLYNGKGQVVATTAEWNSDFTQVVFTLTTDSDDNTVDLTTFGVNSAYRVSTSKADTDHGTIFNDVRFTTRFLCAASDEGETPADINIYGVSGTEPYPTGAPVINEATGVIDIVVYVPAEQTVNTIVPYFEFTSNPDNAVFYHNSASDEFANRSMLPLISGGTAIPFKNFAVTIGFKNNYRKTYTVNLITEELPSHVTANLSAATEGEDLADFGYVSSVKVSFNYEIANEDCITITENGEAYSASNYTVTWAEDKHSAIISPVGKWNLDKTYEVSVDADASIYAASVPVVCDGNFTFTTSDTAPAAEFTSAVISITGLSPSYSFDRDAKEIIVINNTAEPMPLGNVTLTANLSNSVSFISAPQSVAPAAGETEVSISLDLTAAVGVENAITVTVDNGVGDETDYKIYVSEVTPPVVTETVFNMTEDFEAAAIDEAWIGKSSFITNAGFSGAHSGGGADKNIPSQNTETRYAKVVDDGGNKVLKIVSDEQYALSGLETAEIPKSYYADSYKAVFSFDMKSKLVPKVGATDPKPSAPNGRLWIGADIASMNLKGDQNGAAISEYNGMLFQLDSSSWASHITASGVYGGSDVTLNSNGTIWNRIRSTWTPDVWYNVEIVLEKTLVPSSDPRTGTGKYGTVVKVRMKLRDDAFATWDEGTPSALLQWDYTTSNILKLLWNRDYSEAYFDNFRFASYAMDIETVTTLQHGNYIDANGYFDVEFKSPIDTTDIESRLIVADGTGTSVSYNYELSADMLNLRVYPVVVSGNQIYTVSSENLTDIFGNNIVVSEKVPVGPAGVSLYDTNALYNVLANDYSQTMNIYYSYEGEGSGSITATFTYGAGQTATSKAETLTKPADGIPFAVAKVVVPADAVANSGGNVKITVNSNATLTVAGLVNEKQFSLAAVNAANTSTVGSVIDSIVKFVNKQTEYDGLSDKIKEDLETALITKLGNDGPFADEAAVITWATTEIDNAVLNNPNPNVPVPEPPSDPTYSNDSYPSTGSGTTTAPVVTYPQFSDLGEAAWATGAINALYLEGIIDGVSPTKFAPLEEVTREQFVKLVVVAFDMYNPFAISDFDDVVRGAWYDSYIASATKAGIINGMSDTEFGVGQKLTREQMASILKRACDKAGVVLDGYNSTKFTDKETISGYALEDVEALAKAGIINGIDGTFSPKLTANRAMAAQVIYLTYSLKK